MFTILIAEDNRNPARLMEVVLTQNGYKTVWAKDGEEALDMLDQNHIDLILLDIMLPEMVKYSEGDGIILLLENSDAIRLESSYTGLSSKSAGSNRGYVFETVFMLTDEQVQLLKQYNVTDIRINYFDGSYDREIKDEKRTLIRTMLKLFDNY